MPLDGVHREGGLVGIPSGGELYVVSDFHGRYDLFQGWIDDTDIIRKIKDGEDTYALMLGDATDTKEKHREEGLVDPEGDQKIVESVMKIKNHLEDRKDHFIYLQGNHEAKAVEEYAKLKRAGMGEDNRQELIDRLYSQDPQYYNQFDFIKRMQDAHYNFLRERPVSAVTENGIVFVHAGPTSSSESQVGETATRLAEREESALKEIQWGRPEHIRSQINYGLRDVYRFLEEMGGSDILVAGHTPVRCFRNKKNGVGLYGQNQISLDTADEKRYLKLDLDKEYRSIEDINPEEEIQKINSKL